MTQNPERNQRRRDLRAHLGPRALPVQARASLIPMRDAVGILLPGRGGTPKVALLGRISLYIQRRPGLGKDGGQWLVSAAHTAPPGPGRVFDVQDTHGRADCQPTTRLGKWFHGITLGNIQSNREPTTEKPICQIKAAGRGLPRTRLHASADSRATGGTCPACLVSENTGPARAKTRPEASGGGVTRHRHWTGCTAGPFFDWEGIRWTLDDGR